MEQLANIQNNGLGPIIRNAIVALNQAAPYQIGNGYPAPFQVGYCYPAP